MQENRERMVALGVLSDIETGRRSSKKQHSLVLNRRTFTFLGSLTESKIQNWYLFLACSQMFFYSDLVKARNRLACSRRLVSGEQREVRKSKKNDLQVINRQTTALLACDG